MPFHISIAIISSFVFSGAIFGFFYAWVCSTMWGLDAADPRVAISAMQAMNASVRNAVFFPAFFLTPLVLFGSALLVWKSKFPKAALGLLSASAIYVVGALGVTVGFNVPMNEALAMVEVPTDRAAAALIWESYSPAWQVWNIIRTVACLLVVTLVGWSAMQMCRPAEAG